MSQRLHIEDSSVNSNRFMNATPSGGDRKHFSKTREFVDSDKGETSASKAPSFTCTQKLLKIQAHIISRTSSHRQCETEEMQFSI